MSLRPKTATATASATTVEKYRMLKVPLLIREENKENDDDDYDPKVVSLGPYHHGKQKLKFVEDFKPQAVRFFIEDRNEADFMDAILLDIEYAKSCYLEEFTVRYTDEEFALMMFRDACLILTYIRLTLSEYQAAFIFHLGTAVYSNIRRDMYLLENQVPFRILQILFGLKYGTDTQNFIKEMEKFSLKVFFHSRDIDTVIPYMGDGTLPLNLLEIFRRVLVKGLDHDNIVEHCCNMNCCNINNIQWCLNRCCGCGDDTTRKERLLYLLRPVTDLKSKAIHFRASKIQSLKGVRLHPSKFGLSAELQLPRLFVDMDTRVFLKNMIAYEFSPYYAHHLCGQFVTGYVNIMKRLVVSKEDVKELRDKDIIINELDNDEQVVQLYKDLNTYGAMTNSCFWDFLFQMQMHFNSDAKMSIAHLKTKYFDNPWSIFALAGSIFFIFLDVVQTYFAAVPPGSTK